MASTTAGIPSVTNRSLTTGLASAAAPWRATMTLKVARSIAWARARVASRRKPTDAAREIAVTPSAMKSNHPEASVDTSPPITGRI